MTLNDGYTYDPVGNRLTKTSLGGNSGYAYDENDRLKSDGKYTYGWDEAGNLTSKCGPDGTTTYIYDAENRLIETNGPTGWARFAYDAQGNRISRTTSSGTAAIVVDPNMPYSQVLEETGPAGTKVYAYGNDMLNVQGPEGTRWFAYDGLRSTRALTDSSGTLTDTYTYEAFGTVVHRTGTCANDFQFTGEQYEAALGMYYLRARYYDANTGLFGSKDIFSGSPYAPITRCPYLYGWQSPVENCDPSGLTPLSRFLEIAKNLALFGADMTTRTLGTLVHARIVRDIRENGSFESVLGPFAFIKGENKWGFADVLINGVYLYEIKPVLGLLPAMDQVDKYLKWRPDFKKGEFHIYGDIENYPVPGVAITYFTEGPGEILYYPRIMPEALAWSAVFVAGAQILKNLSNMFLAGMQVHEVLIGIRSSLSPLCGMAM